MVLRQLFLYLLLYSMPIGNISLLFQTLILPLIVIIQWDFWLLHTEIWSDHHPVCLHWHEETVCNPEEMWSRLQDALRNLPTDNLIFIIIWITSFDFVAVWVKHVLENVCFILTFLNSIYVHFFITQFIVYCIVHPKMKMLSLFTHPHVVPTLYKLLSYTEHKIRYFDEPNSC